MLFLLMVSATPSLSETGFLSGSLYYCSPPSRRADRHLLFVGFSRHYSFMAEPARSSSCRSESPFFIEVSCPGFALPLRGANFLSQRTLSFAATCVLSDFPGAAPPRGGPRLHRAVLSSKSVPQPTGRRHGPVLFGGDRDSSKFLSRGKPFFRSASPPEKWLESHIGGWFSDVPTGLLSTLNR